MNNNTFQLSEPTVFADLNKKETKEADYVRSALPLNRLKYKHFRDVMKYPEADQMHHLMLEMTGLSESDLGELSPDDAAEISSIIFEAMKKYIQLGQRILKGLEGPLVTN